MGGFYWLAGNGNVILGKRQAEHAEIVVNSEFVNRCDAKSAVFSGRKAKWFGHFIGNESLIVFIYERLCARLERNQNCDAVAWWSRAAPGGAGWNMRRSFAYCGRIRRGRDGDTSRDAGRRWLALCV